MKIAYDAKRFFHNTSGLGNYSRDLIRIMAQNYPENKYVLLAKDKNKRGADILSLDSVSFTPISKGIFSRQLNMGIDAQNLNADIFHGLSGELPLRWNQKKIKKIVTIHDLIFVRYPALYSFFDRKIHFQKFKYAAKTADLIIAISEQTQKDIIDFLKVPEDKIRVVYQGCHQAFKEKLPSEYLAKIKDKFSLPEKFLLNVGTIEERKNLLSVVQALHKTEIPLVAVGRPTSYFKKVQHEAQRLNIKLLHLQHITMKELAAVYQLSNLFIYPSLFEGFGIPIIEALYSNIPVITSNTSSLPEAGGEHSTYINPLDIEDIRSKILFLWNDSDYRKIKIEKNLDFVQKFNDDQISRDLISVYQELV